MVMVLQDLQKRRGNKITAQSAVGVVVVYVLIRPHFLKNFNISKRLCVGNRDAPTCRFGSIRPNRSVLTMIGFSQFWQRLPNSKWFGSHFGGIFDK